MSLQISLVTVALVAIIIVGFFVIMKGFTLPKSFYKNQVKREKMLKGKIVSVINNANDENVDNANDAEIENVGGQEQS